MTETFTFTFQTYRCEDCGSYWAVETAKIKPEGCNLMCPICAFKRFARNSARQLADDQAMCDRVDTLRRQNRALRGVITKLKSK